MRIICSKQFLFTHPKTHEHIIIVPNLKPQDVPDWIQSERLFDLAVGDGSIEVLSESVKKAAKAKAVAADKPTVNGISAANVPKIVGLGATSTQSWPTSPEGLKN